ncbi:GNAT family N-acetyltransferase [Comamonas faecalis]|uniref:GNAT family N-acetyltransferase n=1 Tax=Comamonas faecalis TaxID=1387849 RepID=A0ABP7RED5_9BURK
MPITTNWLGASVPSVKTAPKGAHPAASRRPHKGLAMRSMFTPIRTLGESHRERIKQHLLQLSERDRYLRFGYLATDEQVNRYVRMLDFERDEVLGVFDDALQLVAIAHVAFIEEPGTEGCAEFGVSVHERARGKGHGARLFDRSVLLARNRGVGMMFIHALTENVAMLRIARNAGASVQHDGSESQAHLKLPVAGVDSRFGALVADQLGEAHYQLKKQARHFWRFLEQVQEIRQGVAQARQQSGQ